MALFSSHMCPEKRGVDLFFGSGFARPHSRGRATIEAHQRTAGTPATPYTTTPSRFRSSATFIYSSRPRRFDDRTTLAHLGLKVRARPLSSRVDGVEPLRRRGSKAAKSLDPPTRFIRMA